jgi:hypothetical protein
MLPYAVPYVQLRRMVSPEPVLLNQIVVFENQNLMQF